MVNKRNHPKIALFQEGVWPKLSRSTPDRLCRSADWVSLHSICHVTARYVPSTTGEHGNHGSTNLVLNSHCVGRTNFLDLFGGWLWSHQQHQFVACYLFWAYRKLMRTRNQWLPFLGRHEANRGHHCEVAPQHAKTNTDMPCSVFWCGQSRRSRRGVQVMDSTFAFSLADMFDLDNLSHEHHGWSSRTRSRGHRVLLSP